jgi:hypothetical protein
MFENLNHKIVEDVRQAWNDAGHSLTGKFAKSVHTITKGFTIELWAEEYGIYLSQGVKPSEIKNPYARPRIEGLMRYGQLRKGLSGKEARSFAFAVATKHKKKGMPLGGASHFFDKALSKINEDVDYEITQIFKNKTPKL